MVKPVGTGASRAIRMRSQIFLVISDLFFGVRVADTARALGFTPVDVSLSELRKAAGDDAALVVIDTGYGEDWEAAVRALKAEPASAAIPILAYGSHVDTRAMKAAVAAGCDRLVTRGKLMAELPQLIQATARPDDQAPTAGPERGPRD